MQEKRFLAPKKHFFLFLSIAIFLIVLVFSFFFSSFFIFNMKNTNVFNVSESFAFYKNDLDTPVTRSNIGATASDKVIACATINAPFPEPYLRIRTDHQRLEVYSDDELLFKSDPDIKDHELGFDIHTILLKEKEVQNIRIVFQSPYDIYSEMIDDIWLGNIHSLGNKIISSESPFIIMLISSTLIGLFFMAISIKDLSKNEEAKSHFLFGVFSILWGMVIVCRQGFVRFLFPPSTLYVFYVMLNMAFLVPLFLYVYYISKHTNFIVRVASTIQLIIFLVFTALHFSGVLHYANGISIYNKILIVPLFLVFTSVIIEIIRGNSFMRFLCPWIAIVAVILAFDSYYVYAGTLWKNINLSNYAIYLLMMFVWIYQIKSIINQWTNQVKLNQILNTNNRLNKKNQERMISCFDQTKTIAHEVKHHLVALTILSEDGDVERIKSYLANLDNNIGDTYNLVLSNNYLVDAIISNCIENCSTHDIKVTHEINISKMLPIEDVDMTSLLFNMLDNAFEACAKIEPEKRFIEIIIKQKEQMLMISVKNSHAGFIDEKEKRLITSKNDKSQHGYGIAIMESICKKYDGVLQINYDNDTFIVKTLLPM